MGKINYDRPVMTKAGRKVRILCTDAPGTYSVIGIIEGNSTPTTWTKEGVMHILHPDSELNLANVPDRRSRWVNVYANSSKDTTHRSRVQADCSADSDRIACLELTYEVPNQ